MLLPNTLLQSVLIRALGRSLFRKVLPCLPGFSVVFIKACEQIQPVRIGTNPWPGYLGLYYACDQAAILLAPRTPLSPQQIATCDHIELACWEHSSALIHGGAGGVVQTLERLQSIMLKSGLLEKTVPVDHRIDGSVLRGENP